MSTVPDAHLLISSVVPVRHVASPPSLPPELSRSARQPREVIERLVATHLGIEPVAAIEGNHFAIQAFLQSQMHRPSLAEFGASTQRPGYRPAHRWIIKRPVDKRIAGHVQLRLESLRFGVATLPVAIVSELAVQADFEACGASLSLLSAVEKCARQAGAMVLMFGQRQESALTKGAERQGGWASWSQDLASVVSPQRLLGQLPAAPTAEFPLLFRRLPKGEVILGRLTEAEVLAGLYERVTRRSYGALIRSDEYWTWLLGRGSHQRIFLYTEDGAAMAYVIVRGSSVLELIDATGDARGSARLLEQVALESIEQGRHSIQIYAPVDHPVHAWVSMADGQVYSEADGQHWFAKITSTREILRRLGTELQTRQVLSTDEELGIQIDADHFRLTGGKSSVRTTRGTSTNEVQMTQTAATQLILGSRDAMELAAFGTLHTTNTTTLRRLSQLFPLLNVWRYPWDLAPMIPR